MERLTDRALNRATLDRQLLLERTDLPVTAVIERLVGLQAQLPYSPYYGLWTRLARFDPDALGAMLVDRTVVRISLMRGTVHLVTAADCRFLRPALAPLHERFVQATADTDGVDLDELAGFARRLVEAEPLTNAELGPLLAERWPDHDRAGLVRVVRCLLPLVQVPPRAVWGQAGQARSTTAEHWLGGPLDPAPSAAELVRRYLAGFGPASVADIQTWSGLTKLREVVSTMELRTYVGVDGRTLYDVPDGALPDPDVPAPVRYLPDFDNLLRSHADRRRVLTDDDRARIATKNGMAPHTILVDGFFAGTWTLTTSRGAAVLEVTPSVTLRAADRSALADEGARLLAFAAPDAGSPDVRIH